MMDISSVRDYSLIECQIVNHQHYGLTVHTIVGNIPGYIDKSAISDEDFTQRVHWPPKGERLTCVVLGQASGGRLRLSSRPRDIELAKSVADVAIALTAWRLVRDDEEGAGGLAKFWQSLDVVAVLRWALCRPAHSVDHVRATEIVASAPAVVKTRLRIADLYPGNGAP
ncbi:hypothetical protein OG590_36600 (plasmid) [Streptomyces goshikiensis]|uniref:hypothetical protein n=1 Tax=Streptomyces goshikiensis TaxID=1942 RepID=UPI0022F3B80C|nr:hypothetical protein [Streptomyces goshikiensis]WBY24587.1 hypothetical protein PET44_33500 [Streptomyces goshikiensis]WSS03641.1 hypothetical protein OG224_36855 [Streptomyces goshikiensis]WSY02752.1 hypothetical protein OG590_36600 [Streptomyces goshikiensis]